MSDAQTQSVEVAIAVMTEQINTIVSGVKRIEDIMREQSQALGDIPVIKRDVQELEEKIERAFKAIRATNEALTAQSHLITAQKTSNKIIGSLASAALVVAMGFAGWAWSQLDGLHTADNGIAIRVNSLEIRNAEADKFADKLAGFQRK